ncbi:thiaminase II [Carnobacterium gallinarum]|uniref:thiaminase II n=1 Tax=Carnobacterium gallinarum TaxID=2749 RepID=UPI00054EC869|nr:thiaminase II [Carnobacterium gallinarum]
MTSFTQEMRLKYDAIWQQSIQHPFIQQLANGQLPAEAFRYYLIQDRYYLEHFAKLYQLIADKTTDPELKQLFIGEAEDFEKGERAVRGSLFNELTISEEEILSVPIAPTAYHYVSHMYRVFYTESLTSAMMGLLPCPWLYYEIGMELVKVGSPNERYQRWIETYVTEDLKTHIEFFCQKIDALAEQATAYERQQMEQAFMISSQEELNFWSMALTHEKWADSDGNREEESNE